MQFAVRRQFGACCQRPACRYAHRIPLHRCSAQRQKPAGAGQRLGTGGIDIAVSKRPDGEQNQLCITETDGSRVQVFLVFGIWTEKPLDFFQGSPKSLPAVPHGALDAGPGKAGVAGVALPLNRVVDYVHRLSRTHVDRADRVEKHNCLFFEH